MTPEVIKFVSEVAQGNILLEPIIDFGGLLAEEQKEQFKDSIKNACSGKEVKVFDERPGADIVGNIHNILLPENSVGTALLLETLEHLAHPQAAINGLYRVLKPGGYIIITTLMCWEEHRCPKDFWRFLPDGIEQLFRGANFVNAKILPNGKASDPSSIFAMARKAPDA